jgi:hypothetical protein
MWLLAHHIHGDGSSCCCSLCKQQSRHPSPAPQQTLQPQGSQPNGPLTIPGWPQRSLASRMNGLDLSGYPAAIEVSWSWPLRVPSCHRGSLVWTLKGTWLASRGQDELWPWHWLVSRVLKGPISTLALTLEGRWLALTSAGLNGFPKGPRSTLAGPSRVPDLGTCWPWGSPRGPAPL